MPRTSISDASNLSTAVGGDQNTINPGTKQYLCEGRGCGGGGGGREGYRNILLS